MKITNFPDVNNFAVRCTPPETLQLHLPTLHELLFCKTEITTALQIERREINGNGFIIAVNTRLAVNQT